MTYTEHYKQLLDLSLITNTLKSIKSKIEHRSYVRKTIKDLSVLSDRELADMGIPRCAIRSIAEGTYGRV